MPRSIAAPRCCSRSGWARAIASSSTCRWSRRRFSPCSPPCASARSTRWSSAGSLRNSLATRIDDATPKVMVTADAGMRMGKVIPYKPLVDEALRLSEAPPAKVLLVESRPGQGDARSFRVAMSTTPSCAPSTWTRRCRASGWIRTIRPTSSIRPALRASRRACSATPAAMRSRSRRHEVHLLRRIPARRTSRPRTSAGSSGIRTSCTRRSRAAWRRVVYEGVPIRPDPGIWWQIVRTTR